MCVNYLGVCVCVNYFGPGGGTGNRLRLFLSSKEYPFVTICIQNELFERSLVFRFFPCICSLISVFTAPETDLEEVSWNPTRDKRKFSHSLNSRLVGVSVTSCHRLPLAPPETSPCVGAASWGVARKWGIETEAATMYYSYRMVTPGQTSC